MGKVVGMISASASNLLAIEDRGGMLTFAIFPRNLRSYLLTIVIVAVTAVGAVDGAVVFWATSRQAEMANAEMMRTVKAFAIALDQKLEKTTSSLEGLAAVLADDGDLARFHRIASATRERHSFWSQVTLRDELGRPLLTTAVHSPGPAPIRRSWTASWPRENPK